MNVSRGLTDTPTLGGAVAVHLGAGFVPIRKAAGIFPGPKISRTAAPDYLGNSHQLRMQLSALGPGDRVLLVDDWIETAAKPPRPSK